MKTLSPPPALEWRTESSPVPYEKALAEMQARVEGILAGQAAEKVWFLEHPPLYTAGTSANATDLLSPARFPVYQTGRGGQYTYHGPGQRVAYVMMDLARRDHDLRAHVWRLEEWIIRALRTFDVKGDRREGRIGIWVFDRRGEEKKIAALGVRARRWVTSHGIALNVAPDLSHYAGIVPCGITRYGVTSLKALGVEVSMAEVDGALANQFDKIFTS
ncbi:MAG: lipoyl(octanoyl) transferase LipB [Proteobacteria bacterium]|nr:lipoyl(octanoyl) transferase LipB [Pseudomonadota bacterium]